jgi:hypothetical protein
MENHFTESGEATFFSSQPLSSFHRISRESLLSEKLFGRAPAGFSKESALGALPNAPLNTP